MVAELEGYLDQLTSIRQDAPGIAAGLTEAAFNWRPAANKWSIAECFDHLNITASRFVPAFDAALEQARRKGLTSNGPFAYPLLERWFVRSMEPPVRQRMRAAKAFRPSSQQSVTDVMSAFERWQEAVAERIRAADGIDLRRTRLRSPIVSLISYSLGTGFAAFLAHERRHLWQARQVRNDPAFRRTEAA